MGASLAITASAYEPAILKTTAEGKTEIINAPDNRSSQTQRRAEQQLYTVTPKLTCGKDAGVKVHTFQNAVAQDGSDVYTYFEIEGEVIVPWNLPAGVYDFLFMFTGPDGIRLVAREGVTIDSDTEIEADADEALVNHIEWQSYLPDGSKPVFDLDNGKMSEGVTCIASRMFEAAPIGFMMFDIVAKEFEGEGYRDFQKENDIWVNNTENFFFGQTIISVQDGAEYFIDMPANGAKSQKITNKTDGFSHWKLNEPKDWNTIIGADAPLEYLINGYDLVWSNRIQYNCSRIYSERQEEKYVNQIYFCRGKAPADWSMELFPTFRAYTYYESETPLHFGIELPAMKFENDCYRFLTFRQTGSEDLSLGIYNYDNMRERQYIDNPYLALNAGENPVFGAATPIVLFSRPSEIFGYSYLGRYGELRSVDYFGQDFSIRLDGKEVWTDYPETTYFYMTEDWEPGIAYEKGEWEYEMSASTLKVDGLESRTHCLMRFKESDTFTWPTLTALQFRDNDGNITDRFDTGKEGTMIFYGGEWSGNEFFDCTAPRELKVEYAPYGSDTYTEVEYAEQPDKRFMPAYGNYYEASLAQVTRTSVSGWYDLRFTITDNQGNTQQQTVSPAFRIAEFAGIESVSSGQNDSVSVDNRSIIAPEGATIYSIDGRRVDGRDLTPGTYIVVMSDSVTKVSVR